MKKIKHFKKDYHGWYWIWLSPYQYRGLRERFYNEYDDVIIKQTCFRSYDSCKFKIKFMKKEDEAFFILKTSDGIEIA
jgi:hypothetical protein